MVDRSHQEQRNESKLVVNHPFLSELYDLYTRYAFELMLFEYMTSHDLKVEETKILKGLESGKYTVNDRNLKIKFDVHIRRKINIFILLLL